MKQYQIDRFNKRHFDRFKRAYVVAYSLLENISNVTGYAYPMAFVDVTMSHSGLTDAEKIVFSSLVLVTYNPEVPVPFIHHDLHETELASGCIPHTDRIVKSLIDKHFLLHKTRNGIGYLDIPPYLLIRAVLRVPGKYRMKTMKSYRFI